MTSEKEQFYIQRIAELEAQLKQRDERIAALEKQVTELMEQVAKLTDKVAKLSKNSSNSSKPPSSDIVKPQRNTKSNTPRKIGAQPGHTKHERPFCDCFVIFRHRPYRFRAGKDSHKKLD